MTEVETTYRDNVAVLNFPKELKQFVEDNPRFIKQVGTIIVQISQIREILEVFKEMLDTPEYFKPLLDKAEPGEIEQFLICVKEAIANDQIVTINNIPEESKGKIEEKFPNAISQDLGVV